jgi:N12 class adenine-specific DNA methylase
MKETLPTLAETGMSKSGTDFYAFLLVVLLLGTLALWLWFRYRLQQQSKTAIETETKTNKEQRVDDLKALEGVLKQLMTSQSLHLESMMEAKLKSFKDSQEAQFLALEKKVDYNQRQEEDRLTRLERTVSEGFRAVHDRLDRHIDTHE